MDHVSIHPFRGSARMSHSHIPGAVMERVGSVHGRQKSQVREAGMLMGRQCPPNQYLYISYGCSGLHFKETRLWYVSQKEICVSQSAGGLGWFVRSPGELSMSPKYTGFSDPVWSAMQFPPPCRFQPLSRLQLLWRANLCTGLEEGVRSRGNRQVPSESAGLVSRS